MTPVGLDATGIGRYQAQNRESSQNRDFPAKARVRTKSFGLNIGKFGLTYTSNDLELEPDQVSRIRKDFKQNQKNRAFREDLEVEHLRKTVYDPKADTAPARQASISGRARALAAYEFQSTAPDPAPRNLLSVI